MGQKCGKPKFLPYHTDTLYGYEERCHFDKNGQQILNTSQVTWKSLKDSVLDHDLSTLRPLLSSSQGVKLLDYCDPNEGYLLDIALLSIDSIKDIKLIKELLDIGCQYFHVQSLHRALSLEYIDAAVVVNLARVLCSCPVRLHLIWVKTAEILLLNQGAFDLKYYIVNGLDILGLGVKRSNVFRDLSGNDRIRCEIVKHAKILIASTTTNRSLWRLYRFLAEYIYGKLAQERKGTVYDYPEGIEEDIFNLCMKSGLQFQQKYVEKMLARTECEEKRLTYYKDTDQPFTLKEWSRFSIRQNLKCCDVFRSSQMLGLPTPLKLYIQLCDLIGEVYIPPGDIVDLT